jgi:hypothetical protein
VAAVARRGGPGLLRLVPTGGPVRSDLPGDASDEPAGPRALPTESHAAAPVPTPATTRQPIPAGLPRLLFGRKRKPE